METFNLIRYHQTRDFSKKMSVTFEFVRQNFKPLFKSILFIAGPPILIASLLMGTFINDFLSLSSSIGRGASADGIETYFRSVNFWVELALIFVFFVVSGVATIATINNYIFLYEEKGTNKIEVSDVWERVRKTFPMYLGTMILFAFFMLVAYIVMVIPVALLNFLSPVLVALGVIAFIVGFVYIFLASSFIFIIRGYEKVGFFEAVGRSFKLVRGKWWSTFGLLVILSLIGGTISYVFIIPWYVMVFISAMHNASGEATASAGTGYEALSIFFFTLYYLVQMVLYCLPNIGLAFQYFNLVEMKEAKGLMSEIESLGQEATAPPTEEHY